MNSILNKYSKIFLLLIVLLVHEVLLAQVPQKMSFQAVIRDSNSALITSSIVNIKLSIIQGSENGTTVYSETHSTTTNANGLISIEIGSGSIQSGSFSAINWGTGNYYIRTETDPNGGSNYSIISSSQLLSVPYALYSANGPQGPAGTFPPGSNVGDMQYWNGTSWLMIPIGQLGQTLKIGENSIPQWSQSPQSAIVATNFIENINYNEASCKYTIQSIGNDFMIQNGCCISTNPNPTISDSFFVNTNNYLGTQDINLTNLSPNTTYHVKAFVSTSTGIIYGENLTFTTLPSVPPQITSLPVIIEPCSISAHMSLVSLGSGVIEYGTCYGTNPNPTTSDGFVLNQLTILPNLIPNMQYYYRAFAKDIYGVYYYGDELSFTTLNPYDPNLVTTPIIISSCNSISGSSTVELSCGDAVSSQGICYSTNPNPTIANNYVEGNSFTIPNLTSNTQYYYKVYATNNLGTFYGNELSFTTPNPNNPIIITIPVAISSCYVVSGSTSLINCGGSFSSQGVCYSTSPNPTITDNFVVGSAFTIPNLTSNTQYYYRAFATNNLGTFYGNELSFYYNIPENSNITTYGASSINASNAVIEGNITSAVTLNIVQKGFQISTSPNFTSETSSFSPADNNNIGYFASTVYFQYPLTTYYFRTYYKDNCSQYHYGNVSSFVSANIAFTANAATQITSCSATITGNYFGGSSCVENGTQGICYGTNPNPTIENNNSIPIVYPHNVINLMGNTTYYYRRYVTACNGVTYYSNELSFTTLVSPSIITNPVTNITRGTAEINFQIIGNNVNTVSFGISYGTSPNPTTPTSVTLTNITGSFNEYRSITFLIANTTYYVRAFIVVAPCNTIIYGNEISFTTSGNSAPHVIGENFGGGVVFWVNSAGNHGLVASTTSQGMAEWGCQGISIPTSGNLGTGQSNTNAIIAGCTTPGIAARICNDLILNGYNDWYLPSKDELIEYRNSGFFPQESFILSSTESYTNGVYIVQWNGFESTPPKNIPLSVQAIRSF